jgi:hypothetical protein
LTVLIAAAGDKHDERPSKGPSGSIEIAVRAGQETGKGATHKGHHQALIAMLSFARRHTGRVDCSDPEIGRSAVVSRNLYG